jgi:hypothetical protein
MTAPATFLNAKRIPVKGRDGDEREYYISHFPAVAGREIVTQYPVTAMPKIGEYKTNEALMLRVLSYVAAIVPDGEGGDRVVQLTTRELVDNHAGDYERLLRLEWAMMEYNTSFFGQGKGSTFFAGIEAKAKALISQTLTDFLRQSSRKS